MRQLTRDLLASAARLFSVHRYCNHLKSQEYAVVKDTLHTLLGRLEHAFLVHGIWLTTDSQRRRMSNPRKLYPADCDLIPVFHRSGRPQPGKALETAVLVELLRREVEVGHAAAVHARSPLRPPTPATG